MMAGRDFKDNGVGAANRLKARIMTDLDSRKAEARAWFEALRDRIMHVFEALEDQAPEHFIPAPPAVSKKRPGRAATMKVAA